MLFFTDLLSSTLPGTAALPHHVILYGLCDSIHALLQLQSISNPSGTLAKTMMETILQLERVQDSILDLRDV